MWHRDSSVHPKQPKSQNELGLARQLVQLGFTEEEIAQTMASREYAELLARWDNPEMPYSAEEKAELFRSLLKSNRESPLTKFTNK